MSLFARLGPGVRRYLANASWLLGERLMRLVLGLTVAVLVARYLGPARLGLLQYAISFVAIFGTAARLGLDEILIRELNNQPDERDALLGTAVVLTQLASVAVLVPIAGATQLTRSDSETLLLIAVIAAGFVVQPLQMIQAHFHAQVQAKFVSIAGIISFFVCNALRIVLLALRAPLVWFAGVYFVEHAVRSLGLVALYLRAGLSPLRWRFSGPWALRLLRDSWPQILSGVMVMIYIRIDQIMLKEMLNAEAVGQYAAAVRISEVWYFVPVSIMQALYPAILNARKADYALYLRRLRQLTDLMVWLGVVVALCTALLADWLVVLLYGPQFAEAAQVLALHIWGGIFVGVSLAASRWYFAENMLRMHLLNTLLGAALNVALNYLLIPRYGPRGAALATLCSQAFAGYLVMAFVPRSRPLFWAATRSLTLVPGARALLALLRKADKPAP